MANLKLMFVMLVSITVMFSRVNADRFDDIDSDGDGFIEAEELVAAYAQPGHNPMPLFVAKSNVKAYDENGDGGLDRKEFESARLS
ncbi:15 kDa calcium-binding protein-like [Oculina patagonica]